MVLSGGGARGIAHIGVLKAMGERGLDPDGLSGTSVGAIVAALHAAGYSAAERVEFFKKKNPFKLSNLSLGKPGFIDTGKVTDDFLEYFPEDSFEVLEKRLFLTATDIVEGRLEIFDSGPLIAAILASSSVPMIFTPTEIDGHWFLDGGILNNFPVEPLEGRCEVIVGVYASPLRRVGREDLKNSLAVSQRALDVGMYMSSQPKFARCDVFLCPEDLADVGTFQTRDLGEIADIGYQAAQPHLDRIEEALARSAADLGC